MIPHLSRAVAIVAIATAAAYAPAPVAHAQSTVGLANPASQNCVAKGGTLTLETRPGGGQYGVCGFPDALQCEEWAMLRGECRTGGVKVTGYATPAARFCAMTGGTYRIVSGSNTPGEKGDCSFAGGGRCDADAWFAGTCARRVSRTAGEPSTPRSIRARFACPAGRSIDATFVNGAKSRVDLVLSDGRKFSLPQAPSASGARYANADESLVFWNKGETAFLQEKGTTTFDGCVSRR